jgi:hypothetical protein
MAVFLSSLSFLTSGSVHFHLCLHVLLDMSCLDGHNLLITHLLVFNRCLRMIEVILSPVQMRRTRNLQERIFTLQQPLMGPVVPTGIS